MVMLTFKVDKNNKLIKEQDASIQRVDAQVKKAN